MILTILLTLLNIQTDFKGFPDRETAEYYSSILGCEGSFSVIKDGENFFLPCKNQDDSKQGI